LLESTPDLKVVGEAGDGRKALQLHKELRPNLVLMDTAMPGMNGIETTRQMKSANNQTKIIILTEHSDARFISEALGHGAEGYFLKESSFEELLRAIKTVAEGQVYLSPAITTLVVKEYNRRSGKTIVMPAVTLSPRECEVVQMLAEGRSVKEIADELKLSAKTIESHRQRVMKRMNIHNLADLTRYALKEGLTQL